MVSCWGLQLMALAVVASLPACAFAERRCTTAFKDVVNFGASLADDRIPANDSMEACKNVCLSHAECGGYTYLTKTKTCNTRTTITAEGVSFGIESQGARCMDVQTLRLLVLPQEKADYPGLDIGSAYAANPKDCSYKCQDTPGCNAYSWTNYNGGSCWMKSDRPDTVTGPYDGSVVSGELYTCSRPHNDADAVGEDLSNVLRAKWSDCCGVCRRKAGCGGFSWSNYNGGTCWLKTNITAFTDVAGVVTALVN